jgi:hypothetical protein
MDEFAYFHWDDAATSIEVVLAIGLWICAVFAIDHWVTSHRIDPPK